jgi:hypothetical protein
MGIERILPDEYLNGNAPNAFACSMISSKMHVIHTVLVMTCPNAVSTIARTNTRNRDVQMYAMLNASTCKSISC